jgi:hypothetical protein
MIVNRWMHGVRDRGTWGVPGRRWRELAQRETPWPRSATACLCLPCEHAHVNGYACTQARAYAEGARVSPCITTVLRVSGARVAMHHNSSARVRRACRHASQQFCACQARVEKQQGQHSMKRCQARAYGALVAVCRTST